MGSWRMMAVIVVLGLSAGCSIHQQETNQLGQVAKGWSRTIRASQVIPVYPLTEDVQVGDVYLVQRLMT